MIIKNFKTVLIALGICCAINVNAQRYDLPSDMSFTGEQHIWKDKALFALTDSDMWLYCEKGYQPALQYLPQFSLVEQEIPEPYYSYGPWGYKGVIGYKVKARSGYYFVKAGHKAIFLGQKNPEKKEVKPLKTMKWIFVDLDQLPFSVKRFNNIWKHEYFYKFYPAKGMRDINWYDNDNCYTLP